jgi:hypothetical protein
MSDEFGKLERQVEWIEDRHQKEREILFANETLLIKILQLVPGVATIGALSQADTLIDLAGLFSFLVFLTTMGLALVAAVLTAHSQHRYKMWDVKAFAAKEEQRQARCFKRSARYLVAMRTGMWTSLILITLGFLQLIVFLWVVGLNGELPADDIQTSVQFSIDRTGALSHPAI